MDLLDQKFSDVVFPCGRKQRADALEHWFDISGAASFVGVTDQLHYVRALIAGAGLKEDPRRVGGRSETSAGLQNDGVPFGVSRRRRRKGHFPLQLREKYEMFLLGSMADIYDTMCILDCRSNLHDHKRRIIIGIQVNRFVCLVSSFIDELLLCAGGGRTMPWLI